MKKVNGINEKLITVLEDKIKLLEEQKVINEKIIEIQKEQLFLCGVGNQLNDLINEKDIGYIEIPKLKITYDGRCFFDDKIFSNIDELIRYYENIK